MKKFEKRYKPYFRVSGERKELLKLPDGTFGYGVTGAPCVRFECLELRAAEAFATDVYRDENLICEIHEVTPERP